MISQALHTLLNLMHQGISWLCLHSEYSLGILSPQPHRWAKGGGTCCLVLLVAVLIEILNSTGLRQNPGRTNHQMMMISHVHLHPPTHS